MLVCLQKKLKKLMLNEFNKKLVIGTVQFQEKYGYFKKITKKKDILSIVKFLKKKNIFHIDTAISYNFLEYVKINKISIKSFKIITKIPLIKNSKQEKKIFKNLLENLKKNKISKYEGILLHDTIDLKKAEILRSTIFMKYLKRLNICKNIGLSLYNVKDYKKIRNYFIPDFIQVPFNIFDMDFFDKKIISLIKKDKTKIHVRSIFLQGVLINKPSKKFKNLKKQLELFHIFCHKNNIKKLDACINFVMNKNNIDKIILGINNIDELKEILSYKKKKLNFSFLEKIKIKKDLIKPYLWNK
mgnify:CR=1 FL=1